MTGEFSCQARNAVGLGSKCSVKVNGPVAAFVVETDYTYVVFGGAGVLLLLTTIITTILCRWTDRTGKTFTRTDKI